MKLKYFNLKEHLETEKSFFYFLASDNSFLMRESSTLIKSYYIKRGFTQTELLYADKNFDWQEFTNKVSTQSLFSEKRIIEIKIEHNINNQAISAFQYYLTILPSDIILIVTSSKIDSKSQNRSWFKFLSSHKNVQLIQIWQLDENKTFSWALNKLKKENLNLERGTIETIIKKTRGNLLATAQEIEKIKLLSLTTKISSTFVDQYINDSSNFTIFSLSDAILSGDYHDAIYIFQKLKQSGTEDTTILWLLIKDIRLLIRIASYRKSGIETSDILKRIQPPIWEKQKKLIFKALNRQSLKKLNNLLLTAQDIDIKIKGEKRENLNIALERLILSLSKA